MPKRIKITKLKPPCEVMVRRVLPSVRAEVARIMVTEYKMLKQEAAMMLGVSNAAISQYISSKRGADADFSDEIKNEIRNLIETMPDTDDPPLLIHSFCRVCKLIQERGWLYKNNIKSSYCGL